MMDNNRTLQINKQGILDRMLRFAAQTSGIRRVELLDPLVVLFIESLAEEIYKLSNEVNNIESRIQETLLNILCPDLTLHAYPAHCVLHARPEEYEAEVNPQTPFLSDNYTRTLEQNEKLYFYPVCTTRIRNGSIRYVIHDGLCYQIEPDQSKTLISRSQYTDNNIPKSYWVGIELDENIRSLKDISFYFDFPDISNKNKYLSILPFIRWKLNGRSLCHRQGMFTLENNDSDKAIEMFRQFDISGNLDKSVFDAYQKHFLTITDDSDISMEKTNIPDILSRIFPDELQDILVQPLLWLEIDYPEDLRNAFREDASISLNAFPVANKYLYFNTIEVNKILQTIPLETGDNESLLFIDSIVDSKGKSYHELPFSDVAQEQYGTYSLRRGGYERYNQRDAKEYLTNLINLLDNHASIRTGSEGNEDKTWERVLSQTHGLIKHIRKSLSKTNNILEVKSYLVIDELEDSDVFFVKYWITNCEIANDIKKHTYMDCEPGQALLDRSSILTLSSTKGGKRAPQSTEKQNLRIKSLMENSIIVTHDDIIRFCQKEFGNTMSRVRISKGLTKSKEEGGGFLRTTDVFLTPEKGMEHLLDNNRTEHFRLLLQKNSPATYLYRIYINNPITEKKEIWN